MINPIDAKRVLKELVEHVEMYLEAAEAHNEATMGFDADDDFGSEEIVLANQAAERVYPKLKASIAEAKAMIS